MTDGGVAVATDAELLARVELGDRHAVADLFDRYAARVTSLAVRILRDRTLADDVVQEVFIGVWKGAAQFDRGRGSAASWIIGLAHHKAVDAVRREDVHGRRRAPEEVLAHHPADQTSPETAAGQSLEAGRVRTALRQLPDAQREVIVLAYFGGYTQQEIASITATPLGTVKTRTLLGMKRLRATLGHGSAAGAEEVAP